MWFFSNKWQKGINPKRFPDVDIDLFKNYRLKTVLSYAVGTWAFGLLKLALFISDLYTCIKLLAYNSWSNNIVKPYLPFRISKWLFSGCILASILLLLWNVIHAIRIYRTKNIALCYVNNICRNSISFVNYPKFCIFDRISSKGTFQWFAFFVFFELKDCLGLLFTDTPRQVINGLTLWSVLVTVHSDLDNNMDLGDLESFQGLINKIKGIAQSNHQEAVLLSFMLFSFIVWMFFMAKLIFAMICSVFVYFRLIHEKEYAGLRDYVCIAICRHVDELITKQNRKMEEKVYNARLLSNTESTLELNSYSQIPIFQSTSYVPYNDSSTSLHQNEKNRYSPIDTLTKSDSLEMDALNELVFITSTIRGQADLVKPHPQSFRNISNSIENEYLGVGNRNVTSSSSKLGEKELLDERTRFVERNHGQVNKYSHLQPDNLDFQTRHPSNDTTSGAMNNNFSSFPNDHDRSFSTISHAQSKTQRPVPPLDISFAQSSFEQKSNIFTPDRAYFRQDIEQSPLLPHDEYRNENFYP
ncbi:Kch1p KNAG_0B00300 [Huiozyma naganishii CBS 8797]|uniref:Vacuolar membrane protein n=1 Tax=Huiozyma naganishii (strain ATCC MYA-139 / BCRC 22969 / CBS 8797 / KCTC 17520 / NBRC 10181 / NCYC 3082 / Yp74L-3) TaxID=1071383 RepID=J7S344_HUIN7|nr:hypothetical protein KNAG_0B00300 [Kazachstania naganishii CBS 8797]CCK68479.1 hypothetical protein KNAG_0B00300 [Kazachstania naganishii CBS 8797]